MKTRKDTTTGTLVWNRPWALYDAERYRFDFGHCSRERGWVQYDTAQDAWYFGIWVHPRKRMILCFAEGDLSLTYCPTPAIYHAELARMAEVYGDPPPAMVGISLDGTVTEYYDTRPQ